LLFTGERDHAWYAAAGNGKRRRGSLGNLLCPRTNFSALFPEARYFKDDTG